MQRIADRLLESEHRALRSCSMQRMGKSCRWHRIPPLMPTSWIAEWEDPDQRSKLALAEPGNPGRLSDWLRLVPCAGRHPDRRATRPAIRAAEILTNPIANGAGRRRPDQWRPATCVSNCAGPRNAECRLAATAHANQDNWLPEGAAPANAGALRSGSGGSAIQETWQPPLTRDESGNPLGNVSCTRNLDDMHWGETRMLCWYVAGTLPDWQGTPLALAVVIEESLPRSRPPDRPGKSCWPPCSHNQHRTLS